MADGGRSARQVLRVGGHEVDVERRIISTLATGRIARITLKSMQVLLVLCEAEGRVVSRETLMERVWKGRFPTDDVLTQAIAQLRRTFRDAPGAPVYVETIAKGGYRLVVPHAWVSAPVASAASPAAFPAAFPAAAVDTVEPEAAALHGPPDEAGPPVEVAGAAAPQVPAPGGQAIEPHAAMDTAPAIPRVAAAQASRRPWQRTALLAVGLPLLLAAGVAGYLASPRQAVADTGPAQLPLHYQAIASSPVPERSPSLSPDGSHIAYSRREETSAGYALFVQKNGDSAAQRLTTPPAGASDHLPVWSPDGRKLSFIRTNAEACAVMVVASTGGAERQAGGCDGGFDAFDWTPDGLGLVMGGHSSRPGDGAGLRRLDLRSGAWQALQYPRATTDVDALPRYSPDGRWLAFRRGTSLGDLWLMPAAGGELQRLTRLQGDIRGWDWLPDSRGLVLSVVKDEAQLYRLSLDDRRLTPFNAPGRGNPVNPDVAAHAWTMVFELDRFRGGLFRRDLAAEEPAAAVPLFPSSGVDVLPAVSPDGTRVAFISDRSLDTGLWLGEPEHPETLRRLGDFTPVPRHAPVWSADGQRMLVVATGPAGDRLLEVEAGSGAARALPVPEPNPAFAAYTGRDDRLLVGVDGGHGRLQLVLYQLPGWTALARVDDVSLARYDGARDRVCFTRVSQAGLWCADSGLGQVSQVSERLPLPERYRDWTLVGGQIQLLSPGVHCQVHVVVPGQPKSGRCLHAGHALVDGSLAQEADGRWAYMSLAVDQNVDVGLARLQGLAGEVRLPPG